MLSLTYLSTVSRLLTREELLDDLGRWRPRNLERDVTGLLLYSGGNVLQTLEGESEVVEGVFTTISADPRHHDVTVVLRREVDDRVFPDWGMDFRDVVRPTPGADAGPDAAAVEGLSDYFARRSGARSPGTADATPEDAVLLLMDIFRASTR